MHFSVEPDGIDALHRQLDRGSQDASSMRGYWEQNAGVSFGGEGLINLFRDADDAAERAVGAFLDSLADRTMSGSSEAVRLAAVHYRTVDRAAAARIDAAMPRIDVPAAAAGDLDVVRDYSRLSVSFGDVAEPQHQLVSLPDFNKEMPYQPSWTDLSSPTALLRDAIWLVTGLAQKLGMCDRQFDIFEVVLKPVCGDWAGMKATGTVMANLSEALTALHDNLGRALRGIDGCWHGNAADAALANLHLIRKSLFEAAISLQKLGVEYTGAATACHQMSSTIGNILSDITDAAVAAAAAGAASGAIAATGVGVPVSVVLGAVALTKVYRVVREVYNVIKIVADMVSRVNALASATQSSTGDFGVIGGSFSAAALPPVPALPR